MVTKCLHLVHNQQWHQWFSTSRLSHRHHYHNYHVKDVHMAGQNAMHLAAQHSQDCLAVLLFGPLRFSIFLLWKYYVKTYSMCLNIQRANWHFKVLWRNMFEDSNNIMAYKNTSSPLRWVKKNIERSFLIKVIIPTHLMVMIETTLERATPSKRRLFTLPLPTPPPSVQTCFLRC